MIINLLFWISISLISIGWGNIFISLLFRKALGKSIDIELPLIFLIGLSIIGSTALYLSLFIPLNWKANLIIAVPALAYYILKENRRKTRTQFSICFQEMSLLSYLILSLCILLVLVIASAKIIHPDTLIYHSQAILWMQAFKAIPGEAHLGQELGLQSSWFAIQAILSPQFKNLNCFFYVNGAILCWYLIFVIGKINHSLKTKTIRKESWGWLILLGFSLLSWTQVRLTAASASPDFIVAIFICAAVYSLIHYSKEGCGDSPYCIIPIIFCSTAIAIKFSAIAIVFLFIPIIAQAPKTKRLRWLTISILVFLIVVSPIMIRNVITSGYPLYPSTAFNFFKPDWKIDESNLVHFQKYITAYARLPEGYHKNNAPILNQWLLAWWKNLSTTDRVFMATILVALVWNLLSIKPFIRAIKNQLLIFLTILLGCLFWFITAPDPRFGTGFLICLLYFLFQPIFNISFLGKAKTIWALYKLTIICLLTVIFSYTGYRLNGFFYQRDFIFPEGIEKPAYHPYRYMNVEMNLLDNKENPCGASPVPCIIDSINNFVPRGNTVEQGFKSKPTH